MVDLVDILVKGNSRKPTGSNLDRPRRPRRASTPAMIRKVRTGVSVTAAERAFRSLDLTMEEAARAVGLSVRTLQRRKAAKQKLDPIESEKVLRLARVADVAADVLGSRDAAADWLREPNAALDGESPLSFLDTDIGANAVLDVLARLEHGVFS